MPDPIPEDLKPLYDLSLTHKAWVRSAYDHISEDGARVSMWELPALIERIAVLEAERDALKAQLAVLEWKPITEDTLPKVGDELYGPKMGVMLLPSTYAPMVPMPNDFLFAGWTHFRPINAPVIAVQTQKEGNPDGSKSGTE